MYKNKKCLGIITARGSSKGLPGKNIKMLLGKPLIAWTIGKALASKYLDRVIVSTDSDEIAEISKKYGAEIPFKRPKRLAGDRVSSEDVVFHAIDYLKKRGDTFDYIALFEPTSPMRKKDDVDRPIAMLIDNERMADSLVSLGKVSLEHPAVIKKVDENGYMIPFIKNQEKVVRRQELSDAYFPYGVIYLSKVQALSKYRSFYQKRTIPYFIERWQCYEVNDIYDFLAIEAIMKKELPDEV